MFGMAAVGAGVAVSVGVAGISVGVSVGGVVGMSVGVSVGAGSTTVGVDSMAVGVSVGGVGGISVGVGSTTTGVDSTNIGVSEGGVTVAVFSPCNSPSPGASIPAAAWLRLAGKKLESKTNMMRPFEIFWIIEECFFMDIAPQTVLFNLV